jgi:hypothetical protein
MAIKKVYLTTEGARVASFCQHNAIKVNFLSVGLGSGENYNPSEATEMTDERLTVPIQQVKRIESNHYKIRAEFSNNILESDLEYREVCLYCTDPEDDTKQVMYCYGNAKTDDYDYTEIIPAFTTSGNISSRIIDIDTYVQGDNATYLIDDSSKSDIATVQELRDDLEQEIEERKNAIIDIEHGGTGETTEEDACNKLLNGLSIGESAPEDNDYYISQFSGGTQKTYHRRPLSALWTWIHSKISSVFGLTATEYNGNSKTATLSTGLKTAGQNGWTPETDTVDNWIKKGTCQWWFNENGNLNNQLSTYGLLVSYVHGVDVHQFWLPQPNGSVYHRSGNSGAIFSDWIKFLDGENVTGIVPNGGTFGQVLGWNSSGTAKWTGRHDFVYTCSTASGTKAKTVDLTGFNLEVGTCVRVWFKNGNSVASPTLNIGGSGAKEIVVQGGKNLTAQYGNITNGAYGWDSNVIFELMYDGEFWVLLGNPVVHCKRTTYNGTKIYADGYKEFFALNSLVSDFTNQTKRVDVSTLKIDPIIKSCTGLTGHINVRDNNTADYYLAPLFDAGISYKNGVYFLTINTSSTGKSVYLDIFMQGY